MTIQTYEIRVNPQHRRKTVKSLTKLDLPYIEYEYKDSSVFKVSAGNLRKHKLDTFVKESQPFAVKTPCNGDDEMPNRRDFLRNLMLMG